VGTATWTAVGAAGSGTGVELRFSDVSTAGSTASASWPYMTRPGTATLVPYIYAFSADTTSLGVLGTTSTTPYNYSTTTLLNAAYLQARWNWDNVGTFASAPIFTAYASTAHAAIVRNTPSGDILAGQTTDTGATQRSYLKGQGFGRVVSAGAPAAAPANVPVITDGATGALVPTAGANWLTNWQGLQGDNDYIQFPSTPAATTADQWNVMFGLFTGPNMAAGSYTPTLSLKYTYG
jgi:hypothetical protein